MMMVKEAKWKIIFLLEKKSNIFPHIFKLELKSINKTDPLQSKKMYPQYSRNHPDLSVLFCPDSHY